MNQILLIFFTTLLISTSNPQHNDNVFDEPIYIEDYHIQFTCKNVDSLIIEYHLYDSNKDRLAILDSINDGLIIPTSETLITKRVAYYKNDTLTKIRNYDFDFNGIFRATWNEEIYVKDSSIFTKLSILPLKHRYSPEKKIFPEHRWVYKMARFLLKTKDNRTLKLDPNILVIRNKEQLDKSLIDSLEKVNSMKWIYSKIHNDTQANLIATSHFFQGRMGFKKLSFESTDNLIIHDYSFDLNSQLTSSIHWTYFYNLRGVRELRSKSSRSYILKTNNNGVWTSMLWNGAGIVTKKIIYKSK